VTEPRWASGSDVELDVLALLLRTNAEALADRLRPVPPTSGASVISALAAAKSLGTVLDDFVVSLVRRARAEGHSWAAVGYALGVSRQAVFQRFGPGTGEATEHGTTVLADAAERAVQALGQFLSGELEGLRAEFDERMTAACSVDMLESVRARLNKQLGQGWDLGEPSVDSQPGYAVVEIPINFNNGKRKGRIALDSDGRIAGFFVLAANAP
jgi:hypothetical protein